MTGHVPGVAVDTVATVADAHALGRHIASLSAVEQADFLAGWASGSHAVETYPLAAAVAHGKSSGTVSRVLGDLAWAIDIYISHVKDAS